jgi:hypothetical protein
MAILVSNQPFTIVVGQSEVGPLDLPNGTRQILVSYARGDWPAVADGLVTATLRVADDGVNFVDIWSGTFEHVVQFRAGVLQTTGQFTVGLQTPFSATARLRVRFDSTVAITTSVTVAAV